MSNFFDMFKSSTPAASEANAQNVLIGSNPTPNLGDSNIIPGAKMPENSSGTIVNPLDAYKTMLDNAGKSSDIQAPSFKLDPKTLGEVSSSMDFTKGLNPDLMQKALGGDAKSLLDVIQAVGRNSYSASLEHATALTETHLGQRAAFDQSRVDKGVKQQLTSSHLSSVANYDHPVVKAELNRVANQYAASNPDASPQQVAQAAQKYIQDLQQAMNPSKTAEETAKASGEMDWSQYLKA